MVLRKSLLALLFLLYSACLQAQLNEDEFNEWVAFKVKSIDDLFERFNGEQNTELNAYIRANFPDRELSRKQWIRSVFDKALLSGGKDTIINRFIEEVTDPDKPRYLNFNDNYWYAKVDCRVTYKTKLYPISLTLKVKKSRDNKYSWSVVSVNAGFLKRQSVPESSRDTVVLSADSTGKYFLSPVSHGIDFVNLDKFFKSRTQVRNYLHQQNNNSYETENLISMISRGELRFNQVLSVHYHMLQIKGWIVGIDYFNRPGRNTGWLISSISNVSATQKRDFMTNKLFIPSSK